MSRASIQHARVDTLLGTALSRRRRKYPDKRDPNRWPKEDES